MTFSGATPFLKATQNLDDTFSLRVDPRWGRLTTESYTIQVRLADEEGRKADPSTFKIAVAFNVTDKPAALLVKEPNTPTPKGQTSDLTTAESQTTAPEASSGGSWAPPGKEDAAAGTSATKVAALPVLREESTMSDAELEAETFLGEPPLDAIASETELAPEDLESDEDVHDLAQHAIMPGGCRCPSRPHQIGATISPSTAASCSLRCSADASCAMF